jgi:hypothetical protein
MMRNNYSLLLIVLYVYDLLITGSSTSSIVAVKTILHDRFFIWDPYITFLVLKSDRIIWESICIGTSMT